MFDRLDFTFEVHLALCTSHMGEEKWSGIHCSTVCEVPLVSCTILCFINNFGLPAGMPLLQVHLPMTYNQVILKSEQTLLH